MTKKQLTSIIGTIITLLLITSCDWETDTQKKEEILFYNITNSQNSRTYIGDSVKIHQVKHHDLKDTLLEQCMFELNGKTHWISLYSNYPNAPIDGEHLAYELDSLGIIYIKSTTWKSYSRLNCTNDSIDKIIVIALENIILNKKFHDVVFK